MGYRYCKNFNNLTFTVNGRVDVPGSVVTLCCEMLKGMPKIPFRGTPEEILQSFIGISTMLNTECRTISDDQKRKYTAGCVGCVRFLETDQVPQHDGLIHGINLSAYPSPCQSHCFYCWVHDWDERFTPAAKAGYEKVFETIELAEHCGLIAPDATWQISSGEITIHPCRDRIMKLVKGKHARFFTNCMKYDEEIAQNLCDNPNSSIDLSIDSGTPKTWAKVKGVDNFEKVTENLANYYVASKGRTGQITLKYIVFPGVNDNYEDYASLMEIMKVIGVKELQLSRDNRTKYSAGDKERITLMNAVAYLAAMCQKNQFAVKMGPFAEAEQLIILELAKDLLRRKQV